MLASKADTIKAINNDDICLIDALTLDQVEN